MSRAIFSCEMFFYLDSTILISSYKSLVQSIWVIWYGGSKLVGKYGIFFDTVLLLFVSCKILHTIPFTEKYSFAEASSLQHIFPATYCSCLEKHTQGPPTRKVSDKVHNYTYKRNHKALRELPHMSFQDGIL